MGDAMHTPALAAIVGACRYLVGRQGRDGFWRDYELPPGASTEWVTAFVGYALLGARSACAHTDSFSRALSALRSSCRPSGWGYNAAVATDADTTAWAVRSFVRAHAELPIEPISCLEAYVGPGGGARTFVCGPRYGRWTIEHVDVTAVLGLAMKEAGASGSALERVRRWTLDQRNGDGLWTSFWWTFDAYATARVLEFLAGTGGIPGDVVEASRCYVEQRRDSATAMETANLLMISSRAGACPDAWISSLLGRQRSDGGWPPSRVLKVPNQKTASEDESAFEDGNGLMSTAMAVMALTEILGKDCDRA
jgi:squalene cyclase